MSGTITGVACYLPERLVTNEELSKSVDTSDEWIVSHTGIRERRLAPPEVASSDLGVAASQKLLSSLGVAPSEIDMVLCATSTPDYAPFPATACLIQERLGCSDSGAFDLQAGCTGFVYGVEVARSLVSAGGASKVLVIGTEKLSSITNWSDRSTCILFGDGAGAVLVEKSREGKGHRVLRSWLRSDGSGEKALIRGVGGSRTPFDPEHHGEEDTKLAMDGRKVYLFAVDAIVRTIRTLCEAEGVAVEELSWIVPHQANLRIIEAAAKRLGVSSELFFTNLDRFANTSAASIPIALEEMESRSLLERGNLVLTVGFGAGLTYGGNLISW